MQRTQSACQRGLTKFVLFFSNRESELTSCHKEAFLASRTMLDLLLYNALNLIRRNLLGIAKLRYFSFISRVLLFVVKLSGAKHGAPY